MKLVNRYTPVAFFAALAVLCPAKLWAEDIEVYYSEVLSDDSVNKNIANVMIMLDTSGSMRNCETGSGSNWCTNSDWRERRRRGQQRATRGQQRLDLPRGQPAPVP